MIPHRRLIWCLLVAVGCASVQGLPQGELVWPPTGISSPGEIVWKGEVTSFKPAGGLRWARTLAGAPKTDTKWRLALPVSVAISNDRLYVIDTHSRSVLSSEWNGSGARRVELPEGFQPIAVAASNRSSEILVADRTSGRVVAFSANGSMQREVIGSGVVEQCGGIAWATNDDILMTDARSCQVVRLSSQGEELARIGDCGSGPNQLNFPTAIVEAPDGSVWVLDTFNFRLLHFDNTLTLKGSFGTHGDGTGHFALPKGLAIDPEGHLYVSDSQFDTLQLFDPSGQLLLVVGKTGTGPGEFWNPAGLSFSASGYLAVADAGNSRVQLLRYQRRTD